MNALLLLGAIVACALVAAGVAALMKLAVRLRRRMIARRSAELARRRG
ncbi:hypothetical protein [Schumannella sp. 10F1B-5-1]|nr:hypothetical protein [Schumannella sp. 10F1B-5-1]